jgi:hypothetical protein
MSARMSGLVQTKMAWARAYVTFRSPAIPSGMELFIADSETRKPLTLHGCHDGTTDLATIARGLMRHPEAELAWKAPPTVVVTDLGEKNGKHGIADFKRYDGRDPRDVETPHASIPTGGGHLLWSASRLYPNVVGIEGSGIDLRSRGGYVILPCANNGRHWDKRLSTTPIAPAPAWLSRALRKDQPATSFKPIESRTEALWVLRRAVVMIISGPHGQQENVRHRQCFCVGVLIAKGALDYATACRALIAAANEMPVYGDPWRDLEEKVRASIVRGMDRGQHAD